MNLKTDKRPLRKTTLGNTGLTVSEVGFGGIPLTRVGQDEAVSLVRRALELGFNFFDTARMYGDSEAKLGAALEGPGTRWCWPARPLSAKPETPPPS